MPGKLTPTCSPSFVPENNRPTQPIDRKARLSTAPFAASYGIIEGCEATLMLATRPRDLDSSAATRIGNIDGEIADLTLRLNSSLLTHSVGQQAL
jgi:hypothetical protein